MRSVVTRQKMCRRGLFAVAAMIAANSAALAQTADTAAVRVTVHDRDGLPLAGVHVQVESVDENMKGHARLSVLRKGDTDKAGVFAAQGFSVRNRLQIVASAPQFATVDVPAFSLQSGTEGAFSLTMQVAGSVERVAVTGTRGTVRADSPQVGETLTAEQLQQTPLLNRRMTYLPLLNAANRPAINQGDVFMNQNLFTTNGTGRRQAWFEVDGANSVDSWGRQTIFTNVPLDAVAEMAVLENAFDSGYGFGEGGVVSVVTKSGGDAVHGTALILGRPAAGEAALSGFTAANAASGNEITSDTLLQGAASLSGPISGLRHNNFAASVEYSSQNRASPVTSPVAPGSFVGHYRDWLGFLRLDHSFTEQGAGGNHVFFRGDSDAFVDTNPNGIVGGNTLPSVARTFHRRTFELLGGDTAVLGDSLENEARMQFQLASPITQFSPAVYGTQFVVPISSGGTFTKGTSQSALLENRQYSANDTLTKATGRLTLRVGAEWIRAHNGGNSKEFGGPVYAGQFQYKSCTASVAACESSAYLNDLSNVQSYTQSYGNAQYTVDDTLGAVFAQIDTQIAPNVRLNLGLRYEAQSFTDARLSLAPRIGLAWNLDGRGKTTLRTGFGIYNAQVVDNEEADYALTGPTGVFNYTAAPGQIGFPTSVADAPLPAFPSGATAPLRSIYLRPGRAAYYDTFVPTSELLGYPGALLNPYNEQWTIGLQHELGEGWVLGADYLGSHTLRIVRPLDLDAPSSFVRTEPGQVRTAGSANCTRPYWVAYFKQRGQTCSAAGNPDGQPPYSVVQSDTNDGVAYYEALELNLNRHWMGYHGRGASNLMASYVFSHSIDTVDPDVPSQNPNDPRMTGEAERGNAIFDQRQRLVVSGVYSGPLGVQLGGVTTVAGGLPYNVVTGLTNSGDTGATTDRPVIDGVVVGRNTGRGAAIYDVSPFLEKTVDLLPERLFTELRVEALNVLNHRNVVGYSGTWGNGAQPGAGFGLPLAGVTNQLPARQLQFSARFGF
jgi:hypothetical protein